MRVINYGSSVTQNIGGSVAKSNTSITAATFVDGSTISVGVFAPPSGMTEYAIDETIVGVDIKTSSDAIKRPDTHNTSGMYVTNAVSGYNSNGTPNWGDDTGVEGDSVFRNSTLSGQSEAQDKMIFALPPLTPDVNTYSF